MIQSAKDHVIQARKQGMSIAHYAKKHGLKAAHLYQARQRVELSSSPVLGGNQFVRVVPREDEGGVKPVPEMLIKSTKTGWEITAQVPNQDMLWKIIEVIGGIV